jgi:hypothetical protein
MTMTHTFNSPCLEAFEQLLAQPDPKDLPRRAHILRCEGEPNRRSTRLLPMVMGWLQRRFLEIDGEEAPPSATLTWTRHGPAAAPSLRVAAADRHRAIGYRQKRCHEMARAIPTAAAPARPPTSAAWTAPRKGLAPVKS